MLTELDPIVGNWYQRLDKGQCFEVVAVDEAGGTVEMQHFDGDLEEISTEAWYDLNIEPAEPPEDWTGTVDDVTRDDLGYSNTEMQPEDWAEPLEEVRPSWHAEQGPVEEEHDDWGEGHPKEEPWPGED